MEEIAPQVSNSRVEVERAINLDHVLLLCNQYIGGWTAHQLAALPRGCTPPVTFRSAELISAYALILAQAHCKEERVTAELHAMACFFASAAGRIAQLMRVAPEGRVPIFIPGLL